MVDEKLISTERPSPDDLKITYQKARTAWVLTLTLVGTLSIGLSAWAQTYSIIHNFAGADGTNPRAGLAIDGAGNLYGTNLDGGVLGHGTVYRLKNDGGTWSISTLYSFGGGSDGAAPRGPVTVAPDGSLYGTTNSGGQGACNSGNGCGTVFHLRPPVTARASFWFETVLYRFTGADDGQLPYGFVTLDQAGSVYGTTQGGGTFFDGVVYKLTPSGGSWTQSVLWSFTGESDGAFPHDGVTFDGAGNLYGTVLAGGANGDGVVFQLVPDGSGWGENSLHSFTGGTDGSAPVAGVILRQLRQRLRRKHRAGTDNGGTAFELSSGSRNFSLLYSFRAIGRKRLRTCGNSRNGPTPVISTALRLVAAR